MPRQPPGDVSSMNHTLWIQFIPAEIFNLNAGSLWESVNCFCSIMHRTPSFFFLITEVSGRAVMQTLIFNLTDHHAFIFPFDKSAISKLLHARNAKREKAPDWQSNRGLYAAISADQAANLAPPGISISISHFPTLKGGESSPKAEKAGRGFFFLFSTIGERQGGEKNLPKRLVFSHTFS